MSDVKFVDGLFIKPPKDTAPDFVKGKVSIKKSELIPFLNSQEGDWVNIDLKVSKAGKMYFALDTWSPDPQAVHDRGVEDTRKVLEQDSFVDDDLPF